ncbi:phospholipase/carboxylesterase [Thermoflavifilum aggregans]|uniref:Phospholipase/carboxylesterase n=1 Tax=Thermoflavifilum aggregans TaxID=454188 RepID=A0A2M9CTZ2_9BACT|nr:dienelactone hydrolase family protein [Thermoflavifilum aggregans]MBX6379568.1 dienelactone hydrolase family protein [Thermoflavifilum aggregans]PJJ75386.1 phospholipase/carboxylesterase [Thermoflavifilum aggregans]
MISIADVRYQVRLLSYGLCAWGMVWIMGCQKASVQPHSQPISESYIPETQPPVQTAVYQSINGNIGGFYLALPARYDSTHYLYPLLIFCHGIGELGDGSPQNLPIVLRNGPPKLISQKKFPPDFEVGGQHFAFIVLSPQFKQWPSPGDIQAIIRFAKSHYRIDTTRIYLTGLSMGGGITWDYASANTAYALQLAAILPVAGAAWPSQQKADTMAKAHLPVWALHNQNDPTVTSSYSIDFVNYLNNAHCTPAPRLTIFPVSGHDAWTKAYDPNYQENGLNVYQWMLQYHR